VRIASKNASLDSFRNGGLLTTDLSVTPPTPTLSASLSGLGICIRVGRGTQGSMLLSSDIWNIRYQGADFIKPSLAVIPRIIVILFYKTELLAFNYNGQKTTNIYQYLPVFTLRTSVLPPDGTTLMALIRMLNTDVCVC
jgi:hypothetical protein